MAASSDTNADTLSSMWWTLAVHLAFSVLEIWLLTSGNLKFEHWKDWFIAFGAIFFPFMALLSAYALTSDIRLKGHLRSIALTIQWLLAVPFLSIAAGILGWLLFSLIGWFATIPAWAAVIIILLLVRQRPHA